MKQNTYLKVVRNSLSVMLAVLLGACGSTSIETRSVAPQEFVLRGMTSDSVGDPSYFVIATYNLQGPVSEEKIPLTITGPAAWNNGQPLKTTVSAKPEDFWIEGNRWHLSFSPNFSIGSTDDSMASTPMMPGVYTATTKIAGKTLTSSVDISNILPKPVVSVDAASSSKVRVSWRSIPDAKQYYVTLYNDLRTVSYQLFTDRTNVTFEDFKVPLDTTQNFSVSVMAASEKVYDPAVGDIVPVNLMGSQVEVTNIF